MTVVGEQLALPVQLPEAAGTRSEVGPYAGVLLGALAAISVNLAGISISKPLRPGGGGLRLLHHLYDSGQHLAVALTIAGLMLLATRLKVRRVWALVVAGLALSVTLAGLLWQDLSFFAGRWSSGAPEPALKSLIAAVLAASLVGAWHFGRHARQPLIRPALVLVGLAALSENHVVLPSDYPGVHATLTFAGATLIASAASRFPISPPAGRRPQTRPALWSPPRLAGWSLLAAAVGLAGWSVSTRPSNNVLLELLGSEGSSFAPFLAELHASRSSLVAARTLGNQWFVRRSHSLPTPASEWSPVGKDAIVLLITIDAMRADLLERPNTRKGLSTLWALARQGVNFRQARAPGSQTVYSVTTMFAGTYFSQQYWSKGTPDEATRAADHLFPHADNTLRFPQALQKGGVRTVTFASSTWLVNTVGVVRGFDEERFVEGPETYTLAPDLTNAAIERLERHKQGPLFLYMHYLDPHYPYDRGTNEGPPYKRYLSEIELVDREVGRLVAALKKSGLWRRTVLIVCSDHGEAFGEHGTRQHAVSLYDELLRVPLFIVAPNVEPRSVDEPVSLIDLGPTILDLFGQPTPGHFLGESLSGFLRGKSPKLTRPIIAEGRLKKAWVFADGFKLIVNDKSGVIELYNLRDDPAELENIFDTEPSAEARLATLRTWFDVHRIRRRGYKIPLRR